MFDIAQSVILELSRVGFDIALNFIPIHITIHACMYATY